MRTKLFIQITGRIIIIIIALYSVHTMLACGGGGDGDFSGISALSVVTSTFSCETDSDCVFTLRKNTPTNASECVCDHLCFGDLVNLAEKTAREDAYTTFCNGLYQGGADNGDGSSCPMAGCSQTCYVTTCEDNLCVANEIPCDSE